MNKIACYVKIKCAVSVIIFIIDRFHSYFNGVINGITNSYFNGTLIYAIFFLFSNCIDASIDSIIQEKEVSTCIFINIFTGGVI